MEIKCTNCNFTPIDISKNGRFGCPECYETFKQYIPNNQNGATKHIGKRPKTIYLKEDLQKAIEEERYEDAQKIKLVLQKAQSENPKI